MELIFAGGSHYEIEGLKSVQKYFDKIYVLNEDADGLKSIMRPQDEMIDNFEECDCKYIFLCGYARFITEQELSKKIFINVHGALLPKYRGKHSTFYAIMNGEEKLGITFHLVDKYMDSGDILAQFSFEYNNQTVKEINDIIDRLVGEHAGEVCYNYITGNIIPTVQDEERATFGAKRNLDDCYVDFMMSNVYLERFFKALTPPYPCPMLLIKKKRYEIVGNMHIVRREYFGPLGRAVNINDDGVWIKTAEGFLVVEQVRDYETKRIYKACDLIPIGYRFRQ